MSSTRSIISPPVFAEDATTTIPPTPVAGVSYRDPIAGPASSTDGWPYAERVNSAEFNQIMYQLTALVSIQDQKGVLGWSDLVDYPEAAVQFGSDGVLYVWLQQSGPTLGGAKDPVSNPTFWRALQSGQLANTQTLEATGTVTKTPGVRIWEVMLQAGGGQGGGTQALSSQVAAAGGGSAGSWAVATFDVSSISSASLVIGSGGSSGAAGADGAAGGSSTLTMGANSLTCPGGPGGKLGPATNSPPQDGGQAAAFSAAPTHVGAISFAGTPGGGGTGGFTLSAASAQGGLGGSSQFGYSRAGVAAGNSVGYGSGGGGERRLSGGAVVGYFGSPGICIIKEYF